MLFNWLSKKSSSTKDIKTTHLSRDIIRQPTISYGWIITGKLVIGSMPRAEEDWSLLENLGITKRFSCCYPKEHVFSPIPSHWLSEEVSLPDHRLQEELSPEKLKLALDSAISFIEEDGNKPIYLHCLAGQERSCLLAVGIVCRSTNKNVFEGLEWVRQCYKRAKPLYQHLEILEQILQT
jgi:protein-tyrosine phosphatase